MFFIWTKEYVYLKYKYLAIEWLNLVDDIIIYILIFDYKGAF